jgi:hypothetical protein
LFHGGFLDGEVGEGQDRLGVPEEGRPAALALNEGDGMFRQGYGQGDPREARPGTHIRQGRGFSGSGGAFQQAPDTVKGGQGIEDVFYHQFPPVPGPHQAVGGVKQLNFFYIFIQETFKAVVEEGPEAGVPPPQAAEPLG